MSKRRKTVPETALYPPIKTYLEGQGYEVKGEIGPADIVARRGDGELVVVELKTGFSLTLFHQAIARQAMTDRVYVAVPRGAGRPFMAALSDNSKLCRRLGLGLITVRLSDGFVETHLDPAPHKPRLSKPRRDRLLREFDRRVGDPSTGGSTRKGLVTAYRQDALKCLSVLHANGPTKVRELAAMAGVPNAGRMLLADHYGWFERVARGVYDMSPKGRLACDDYRDELSRLSRIGGED